MNTQTHTRKHTLDYFCATTNCMRTHSCIAAQIGCSSRVHRATQRHHDDVHADCVCVCRRRPCERRMCRFYDVEWNALFRAGVTMVQDWRGKGKCQHNKWLLSAYGLHCAYYIHTHTYKPTATSIHYDGRLYETSGNYFRNQNECTMFQNVNSCHSHHHNRYRQQRTYAIASSAHLCRLIANSCWKLYWQYKFGTSC